MKTLREILEGLLIAVVASILIYGGIKLIHEIAVAITN